MAFLFVYAKVNVLPKISKCFCDKMPKISKYWVFLGGFAEILKMFWWENAENLKMFYHFTILLLYYSTILLFCYSS